MSLSSEAMESLDLLRVILASKDLSAISTDQLFKGIDAIDGLQNGTLAILAAVTSRFADQLRTEGIDVAPSIRSSASEKGRFDVHISYSGGSTHLMSAVTRLQELFQKYFRGKCTVTPLPYSKPSGGEAHFQDHGEISIEIQLWQEKTTARARQWIF